MSIVHKHPHIFTMYNYVCVYVHFCDVHFCTNIHTSLSCENLNTHILSINCFLLDLLDIFPMTLSDICKI